MTRWSEWVGREERVTDRVTPAFARRWCATFDMAPIDGGALPQGAHWCLATPETPTAALGSDGHPRRDESSWLPPVPQPRRMWAGSEIEFLAPLAVGQSVERVSRIASVEEKDGRSGPLAFATVEHSFHADGALAVHERQTLVFREAAPASSAAVPPAPGPERFDASGWDRVERLIPQAPLLFRYSALTFNTHRIHYDADYVREVEGYRGLVVHGPLMASWLLQLAARELGENMLVRFGFRALSPAIAGEVLVLALARRETLALGVFASDGREVMRADAVPA